MSANDLALYMESSETTKLSIIRRNKYPSALLVSSYQEAKKWIVKYLCDSGRDRQILVDATESFEQQARDPQTSEMRRDDANRSLRVLKAFWDSQNKLGLGKLSFTALPGKQLPLNISGVRVSITLDALSHAVARGEDLVGGVILRLTQVEDTENAKAKREAMGHHAATLAYMQMMDKKPTQKEPTAKLCLAIDVQNGKACEAKAGSRRISDLESACRMIASIWPSV
jgi:hypothetical protein